MTDESERDMQESLQLASVEALIMNEPEDRAEQIAHAKKRLAALWADGNAELTDAYEMAFNEMESIDTPNPTVDKYAARPDWPAISRGESVIFKDHWCRVEAFTAKGVELSIGEPTAALRKRVIRAAGDTVLRHRKQNKKKVSARRRLRESHRQKRNRRTKVEETTDGNSPG